MKNDMILAFFLFFVQPAFYLGLILAIIRNYKRLKREREQFQSAIYRDRREIYAYLFRGLPFGLILSLIIFMVGIPISLEWLMIYQILASLALLLGGAFLEPALLFSLALLVTAFLPQELTAYFSQAHIPYELAAGLSTNELRNGLILLVLASLPLYFLLKKDHGSRMVPSLKKTKRGKYYAVYDRRFLYLLPLVLLVPGRGIQELFSWWPAFNLAGESYAIILSPVMIGLTYSLKSSYLEEVSGKLTRLISIPLILAFLLIIGSYLFPGNHLTYYPITAAALVFLSAVLVRLYYKIKEERGAILFTEAGDGLRIVGKRPATPAEKLDVSIGDVILDVNGMAVNNLLDWDLALAKSRSYVRIRLRRLDGELILREMALYADDPYDLGLILLASRKNYEE